jgi:hypothetical protein
MNKPVRSSRWYAPWRRSEARAQDDPADLGTCYGLELTLAAEPSPAKPAARRPSWMQRLAGRRRAAA